MNWWLILCVALAVLIVIKFISFRHLKHKIFAVLGILLLLFLYLTFTAIVSHNNLNLKTASGIFRAVKIYFSWFSLAFNNLKAITANAVNMDWIPEGKNISDYNPLKVMKG